MKNREERIEATINELKTFERENNKLSKADIALIIVITLVYAVISFINLGSADCPSNAWETANEAGQYIIELSEDSIVSNVIYMPGVGKGKIIIESSSNGKVYERVGYIEYNKGDVYKWNNEKLQMTNSAKYIKLSVSEPGINLLEMQLLDEKGEVISIEGFDDNLAPLFDEQEYVKKYDDFLYSMYFDEIFDASVAYEFIHGLEITDPTHPPMAKILTAIGIKIFGMNPFGWRAVPNIFGIAMIPLMYLFGLLVFRRTSMAVFCSVLMACDFSHFVQTRISTLEMYIVSFIICMYYFMYKYMKTNYNVQPLKKTFISLGACGVFFGLGLATKWSALFAGLGLAVLFFVSIYKRTKEYRYAKLSLQEADDELLKSIVDNYRKNTLATILFCIVFFVVVPMIIFTVSYIPYLPSHQGQNLVQIAWDNIKYLFSFHSDGELTWNGSSKWYMWPFNAGALKLYDYIGLPENLSSVIYSFGNPLVWCAGSIAAFSLILGALFRKVKPDDSVKLIIAGYGAQYFPWIFVGRFTIIYYYFASVPFLILSLAWWMVTFTEGGYGIKAIKKPKLLIAGFLIIAAALFAVYYPAISGMVVSSNYISRLPFI